MAETGNSFIRKFLGFSLSTWISFIIGFIAAPISTRIFDPDVHGKISIFNTYSTLLGIFVLIGLDQAFARFYNERPMSKSKNYLFTFCISLTYAVIFVISVTSIPVHDWINNYIFGESDSLLLILFFISVFSQSTIRYLTLIYRMEQDIKMYTIQGVLNAIVSRFLYICVGFWDPSYKPALIALVFSQMVLSLSFLYIQRNRFCIIRNVEKNFTREIFSFSFPLIPVSVLTWANSSVPTLIMQHTMDYYTIGIFSSAVALANLLLVVQQGFNSFWVPYTYENYKTQNGQFYKVYKYLVCVLTLLALMLVCFQDIIFLILGEKYREAKSFFPFLVLGPICYIIGEVIGVGIDISKKTYYKLYIFIVSIAINITLCFVLGEKIGVAGIAISTASAAIIAMLLKLYFGEKYYKVLISYKHIIACVVSIVISSFVTLLMHDIMFRSIILFSILCADILIYRKELLELYSYARRFSFTK